MAAAATAPPAVTNTGPTTVHVCNFAYDIVVLPAETHAHARTHTHTHTPYFRFWNMNGEHITTEPVGGSGWEPVLMPGAGDAAPDATSRSSKPGTASKDTRAGAHTHTSGSTKTGGTAAAGSAAAQEAPPAPPRLLRYTHVVQNVECDAAWAYRFNLQPVTHVLMGLMPEGAAPHTQVPGGATTQADTTAKAGAAGKKGDKDKGDKEKAGTATAATVPGAPVPATKPFVGWIPLDCSGLLANDASAQITLGSVSTAIAALAATTSAGSPRPAEAVGFSPSGSSPRPGATSPPTKMTAPTASASRPSTPLQPASSPAPPVSRHDLAQALDAIFPDEVAAQLPCPLGLQFMHIAVRVVGASRIDAASQTGEPTSAPPTAGGTRSHASGGSAAAPASTTKSASKGAVVGKPGMAPPAEPVPSASMVHPPRAVSDELLEYLNPLKMQLGGVYQLPGIVLPEGSDASLRQYVYPSQFSLMQRHCRPVYAVMRWYDLPLCAPPDSLAALRAAVAAAAEAAAAAAAAPTGKQASSQKAAPAKQSTPGAVQAPATSPALPPLPVVLPPAPHRIFELSPDGLLTLCSSELHLRNFRRVIFTPAAISAASITWDHSTTICLGFYDPTSIRETLSSMPVEVELHDRDVLLWERLQEAGEKAVAPTANVAEASRSLWVPLARLDSVEPVPTAPAGDASPSTSRAESGRGRKPSASTGATSTKAVAGASTAKTAQETSTARAGANKTELASASTMATLQTADASPRPATRDTPRAVDAVVLALPDAWPFPTLPHERQHLYEQLLLGAAPCPFEAVHQHAEQAAADAAAAAEAPPATSARKAPGPADAKTAAKGSTTTSGVSSAAAGHPTASLFPRHAQPQVDMMAVSELLARVLGARERHAHGVARVRLDGLLARHDERLELLARSYHPRGGPTESPPASGDAARDTLGNDSAHDSKTIKLSSGIGACKRTNAPLVPEPMHCLDKEQTLCLAPGAYAAAESRVKLSAEVLRPRLLHASAPFEAAPLPPFERMFAVFAYENDALLHSLMAAIERVNMACCGDASSYRSHVFTHAQAEAANQGELDVITGFQVITGSQRVFVLEGLGDDAGKGMAAIRAVLRHDRPNSREYRVLSNPCVRYHQRLYTTFNAAPKNLRLRTPLAALLLEPSAADFATGWHRALSALANMLRSESARTLKDLGAFPSVSDLLEVENKHGGTVSLRDIFGSNHPAARALEESQARLSSTLSMATKHADAAMNANELFATQTLARTAVQQPGDSEARGQPALVTDSGHFGAEVAADQLLPHARAWPRAHSHEIRVSADRVAGNIAAVASMSAAAHERKLQDLIDEYGAEEAERMLRWSHEPQFWPDASSLPGQQVFMYSGQKLNTTEWQRKQLRDKLAKDRGATFTYSADFNSMTMGVVDESELGRLEQAATRAKWKTQRGFVYPATKTRDEYVRHAGRPTDARVDELREPWEEPMHATSTRDHTEGDGKPLFQTMPDPHPLTGGVFGYVGPRGEPVAQAEFFKSVHLTEAGLAAERAAAREKEKQDWASRLVVDSAIFHRHHSGDAARASRYGGMFTSVPRKAGLLVVHNATLPSGKPAPLEPAPVSMWLAEPRSSKSTFHATLRTADPESFVARDNTGAGVDFCVTRRSGCTDARAAKVYRPGSRAASGPNAPVGRALVPPTHIHGINTDPSLGAVGPR